LEQKFGIYGDLTLKNLNIAYELNSNQLNSFPHFFYVKPLVTRIQTEIDKVYKKLLITVIEDDFSHAEYRLQEETNLVYSRNEGEMIVTLYKYVTQFLEQVSKSEWIEDFEQYLIKHSSRILRIPYITECEPEITDLAVDINQVIEEAKKHAREVTERVHEHTDVVVKQVQHTCEEVWEQLQKQLEQYKLKRKKDQLNKQD